MDQQIGKTKSKKIFRIYPSGSGRGVESISKKSETNVNRMVSHDQEIAKKGSLIGQFTVIRSIHSVISFVFVN